MFQIVTHEQNIRNARSVGSALIVAYAASSRGDARGHLQAGLAERRALRRPTRREACRAAREGRRMVAEAGKGARVELCGIRGELTGVWITAGCIVVIERVI
jgi:hypothetical protein